MTPRARAWLIAGAGLSAVDRQLAALELVRRLPDDLRAAAERELADDRRRLVDGRDLGAHASLEDCCTRARVLLADADRLPDAERVAFIASARSTLLAMSSGGDGTLSQSAESPRV